MPLRGRGMPGSDSQHSKQSWPPVLQVPKTKGPPLASQEPVGCHSQLGAVVASIGSPPRVTPLIHTTPFVQGEQCSFFKWVDEAQGSPQFKQGRHSSGGAGRAYPGGGGAGISGSWKGQGSSNWANEDNNGAALLSGNAGTCFKCGQPGHWASSCTNASGGGDVEWQARNNGGPAGSCFKCGMDGHWSRDCPSAARGQSQFTPPAAATAAPGGGAPGTCFKCGNAGHWARDCPDPGGGGRPSGWGVPRGGGGGTTAPSSTCFKCGGVGHWARDCRD